MQYLGHAYTKKLFVVYLIFRFSRRPVLYLARLPPLKLMVEGRCHEPRASRGLVIQRANLQLTKVGLVRRSSKSPKEIGHLPAPDPPAPVPTDGQRLASKSLSSISSWSGFTASHRTHPKRPLCILDRF